MSKSKKSSGMPDWLRYILFTVVVIGVVSLIGYGAFKLLDTSKQPDKPKEVVKVNEQEIEGYGIFIDDSDTTLYRNEFQTLKTNLTSEEINYDEYAKSVAKMFIIDLYTIKNKINKYDVGGIDFIYKSAKENYITNVTDTLYKYVEDDTKGEREQQLPAVKSIEIESFKKGKFKVNSEKKEYESYNVKLNWTYSIDLGYDTTGEVIIINKDNKLYVVEKN